MTATPLRPSPLAGRGPVVLEPIVLPPEAAQHEHPPPPAPMTAPRRGPPLRPLLQRSERSQDEVPWWAPAEDSEDDDDQGGWLDLERRLPSVLQFGSPDCLPMDHTLPHLLRQVAGTDDLPTVRSLKLRVIGREMSLQRLCVYVPNLVELNLDGSSVGSLRELGCGLSGLKVLRVTRCGLDSLDGTFGLTSLTELYAAYNRVQDIGYLACLPNIEYIDLRGNHVSDIRYAGFLTVCALLRELVLAENPCALRPGYRAAIRELLPSLNALDGVALGNYQQDDEDTDSFSFGDADGLDGLESDSVDVGAAEPVEREGDGTPAEVAEEAEAAAGGVAGRVSVEGTRRPWTRTPSETDESTSSSSARGTSTTPTPTTPVDASRLWTDARHRALADRKRPSTATCATPRRPPGQPLALWGRASRGKDDQTARPMSAGHPADRAEARHAVAGAPGGPGAVDADAPSPLTSGGVVCGNLSVALRRARRRKEAWGMLDPTPSPSPSPSGDVPGASLLAASREWRAAYHSYRDSNKLKWDEEDASKHQEDNTIVLLNS